MAGYASDTQDTSGVLSSVNEYNFAVLLRLFSLCYLVYKHRLINEYNFNEYMNI